MAGDQVNLRVERLPKELEDHRDAAAVPVLLDVPPLRTHVAIDGCLVEVAMVHLIASECRQ